MSPLPRNPKQGDAARLQQVASGLKQEHGTHGAVVQRNEPGRPTGSTGTPAPRASQPEQDLIRPEHKALADELRDAEQERQRWRAVAQQSPTPWVMTMLDLAEQDFQVVSTKFYNVTPNAGF